MEKEPSILDYLKSRLMPWRGERVEIPPAPDQPETRPSDVEAAESAPIPPAPADTSAVLSTAQLPESEPAVIAQVIPESESIATEPTVIEAELPRTPVPLRSLLALTLGLLAQSSLQPTTGAYTTGAVLLVAAFALAIWAGWRGEWRLPDFAQQPAPENPIRLRPGWLVAALLFSGLTFLISGENRLSGLSLVFTLISLGALTVAALERLPNPLPWLRHLFQGLAKPRWQLQVSRTTLLLLLVTGVVFFFRFYRLDSVPPEMVSDHAEKYLDVRDILAGAPHIFFPRNGGREALQFYFLAFLVGSLGMAQNFLTLKLSTSIIGALSLPFVYLVGKEFASRRVGLLAFFLAGTAYWTNVVSRAGMRLPFYMLFTAATTYFVLRALRRGEVASFIAAGICLGLGLYGYSADRILPFLAVLALGLYLLSLRSRLARTTTLGNFTLLVIFSLLLFTPLLRYIMDDPLGFGSRMFSRMGSLEQPLPGNPLSIFLDNQWRALQMFSISAGVIWPVSIPNSPALGTISGGLFYAGLALVLVRATRQRGWQDMFIVLSIPLLMLPSTLSLAFPGENPNLYRTGGVMLPVFLLAALALDGLIRALESSVGRPNRWQAWVLPVLLLVFSATQDYGRVFNEYTAQYRLSAWNYSEVGQAIHDFGQNFGSTDSAWVVGYPYWLDTRLVALEAGTPLRDYAIFPEQLSQTSTDPGAKMFILNPQDIAGLDALQALYPNGWAQLYHSAVETKDFWIFFAPPAPGQP